MKIEEAYSKYWDACVVRASKYLFDPEMIDDVVSETFLTLGEYIKNKKLRSHSPTSIKSFLFRVIRTTTAQHLLKKMDDDWYKQNSHLGTEYLTTPPSVEYNRKYQRELRQRNGEYIRTKQREYYYKFRDRIRKAQARYRDKPERRQKAVRVTAAWRKMKSTDSAWLADHRERMRVYRKNYRERQKNKVI